MKRTMLALSVLAASGGVAAQSSITVFGVIDAGVSHYSTKSRSWGPTLPRQVTQSQTVLSPSGYASSRLGFRGTEDLGGGLSAGFWLEAPLSNDTGGGIANFGRRSTLSLSGPFGELRLGRDYTASFWNDAVFDPFSVNGVGTNLIAVASARVTQLFGAALGDFPRLPALAGIGDQPGAVVVGQGVRLLLVMFPPDMRAAGEVGRYHQYCGQPACGLPVQQ